MKTHQIKQIIKFILKEIYEGEEKHPELRIPQIKKMFSAPMTKESENIGEWVMFEPYNKRTHGLTGILPYKIMHIQKQSDQSLSYRIENQMDTFGRPAQFNEVRLISVEEARNQWNQNVEIVYNKYIEFKESW